MDDDSTEKTGDRGSANGGGDKAKQKELPISIICNHIINKSSTVPLQNAAPLCVTPATTTTVTVPATVSVSTASATAATSKCCFVMHESKLQNDARTIKYEKPIGDSSVKPKALCSAAKPSGSGEHKANDVNNKIANPITILNGNLSSAKAGPSKIVKPTVLPGSDPVVLTAQSLANFIVDNMTSEGTIKPRDKIEESLLKNVTYLLSKHEILFRSMMRRLKISKDTGYHTFATVANEVFENEKRIITWGRIIALYAFGAQLALYCKENNFVEYAKTVAVFLGNHVAEMAGHFIKENGGWVSHSFILFWVTLVGYDKVLSTNNINICKEKLVSTIEVNFI